MSFCRACSGTKTRPYIEFGLQPISTMLYDQTAAAVDRYPLDFDWCETCGHVQIRSPFDLSSLYSDYPRMRSATTPPYVGGIVDRIKGLVDPDDLVLEIASNDGMFIEHLKARGIQRVVGVESAENCVEVARRAGIHTIHAFFNSEFAQTFVKTYGKAKVIVARHVVEHIDHLDDFMAGISHALRDDGTVVIEVPDIQWAIQKGDFTSFTEQHISYFSRYSLLKLLSRYGLRCDDLSVVPNNWSDALLTFCSRGFSPIEDSPIAIESSLVFRQCAQQTEQVLSELVKHKKIGLFGGFCRTANLLNYTSLHRIEDRFLVTDDDPRKHGKFLPRGSNPIVPFAALEQNNISQCIICAINYEERIILRHQDFAQKGSFMTLFPLREIV